MPTTTDTVVCACSKFEVAQADGTKVSTNCTSTTKKTFAPGHDAKLKALLVKAGVGGHSVHVVEDDGSVSVMTHTVAAEIHGMVEHVKKGVHLALERKKKDEESVKENA